MPVPARNPEWPLLAEAARAAAIAKKGTADGFRRLGVQLIFFPTIANFKFGSRSATKSTAASARRQVHGGKRTLQARANLPISVFEAVSILI